MGKRERGWGECFFFFSSLLFETPSPPRRARPFCSRERLYDSVLVASMRVAKARKKKK